MSDLETLTSTCVEVVGAGKLCGAPCGPGRVRCSDHAPAYSEARAANAIIEAARQRVLLRFEERADDLAACLFDLMTDPEVAAGTRLEAVSKGFQILGLDKVQIQVETTDVTPGKASRDARLLDLLERAGAPDRAQLVRSALGVVEATATDG